MSPLREQLEYAVFDAAHKEREAWHTLEEATHTDHVDPSVLEEFREHWQSAAHALAAALRALKR